MPGRNQISESGHAAMRLFKSAALSYHAAKTSRFRFVPATDSCNGAVPAAFMIFIAGMTAYPFAHNVAGLSVQFAVFAPYVPSLLLWVGSQQLLLEHGVRGNDGKLFLMVVRSSP